MNSFFTWIGIIFVGFAFLLWFIPTLALGGQFWYGLYVDMIHFRERRRDKKA